MGRAGVPHIHQDRGMTGAFLVCTVFVLSVFRHDGGGAFLLSLSLLVPLSDGELCTGARVTGKHRAYC